MIQLHICRSYSLTHQVLKKGLMGLKKRLSMFNICLLQSSHDFFSIFDEIKFIFADLEALLMWKNGSQECLGAESLGCIKEDQF